MCCYNLYIEGFGKVVESYPDLLGVYHYHSQYNNNAAYKKADREYYLFRGKNEYTMDEWWTDGVDDEFWVVNPLCYHSINARI